jgi:hypothetical protein
MANDDQVLERIDSKLTALLALVLDSYLRNTGVARPRERSIDLMLSDAGLSASTIAGLLGKTDRAVHKQLQNERDAAAKRKAARKRKPAGGDAE